MYTIRGTLDGKLYWIIARDMGEVHSFLAAISKSYTKVKVWVEDLAGKIVLSFERFIDRLKMAVPKRRSIWRAVGQIISKVF